MIPSPASTYHMAGIPYIFVSWRKEVCNLSILGKREHRTRCCEFGYKRLSSAWEATWWWAPIFGWKQSVGMFGRAGSPPLSLLWPPSRQHPRPSSHHLPGLILQVWEYQQGVDEHQVLLVWMKKVQLGRPPTAPHSPVFSWGLQVSVLPLRVRTDSVVCHLQGGGDHSGRWVQMRF